MNDIYKRNCYLCGCSEYSIRPGSVRDDKSLNIFECKRCGLVFLSKDRVPEAFYEQSHMHGGEPLPISDWLHEAEKDDERRFRYLSGAITNKDVLDFGCGVGGFLLKARSVARRVVGIELEKRLQVHFREKQLDVFENVDELPVSLHFDIITAFHVIEHLENPANILEQLSSRLREGGKIIVEVPSSSDALLTLYESIPFSEFTYWSCHLYLFNAQNLPALAKKAGLTLNYVNHIQRYSLSNHLYWLAKGKPGGHQVWSFIDSDELSRAYEAQLARLGRSDTLIACLSL